MHGRERVHAQSIALYIHLIYSPLSSDALYSGKLQSRKYLAGREEIFNGTILRA